VWLHRSFGPGSVSANAEEYGRTHDITVLDGGCPLMYPPAAERSVGGPGSTCLTL
jgi:hypothetical protein